MCIHVQLFTALYTHIFYMQHNTIHHMCLRFISALNSCCIAALKLLCTSYYFKPVFVCIQYDSFTCCFMTYLKALILNISLFIPLQIHLMSLYSSIPFFVIQILFMTCFHACSSLPHYIFQES